MSPFVRDLRYAFRQLRQSPRFAIVVLISLGLGIGANTAIFSLLNSVLLKSLPVRDPNRLVLMVLGKNQGSLTYPIWEAFRDRRQIFDGALAWATRSFNLGRPLEPNRAPGLFVSGSAFPVLGVQPAAGRLFAPDDDKPGCESLAVLGYGYWADHYGQSVDAIGKSILLDGKPFTIIGVTQRGFFGLDVGNRFSVAVPFCSEPLMYGDQSSLKRRSTWWLNIMGRLKPGQTIAQADAAIQAIQPSIREATIPENWRVEEQKDYLNEPFTFRAGSTGVSFVRRQYESSLFILMGLVGLVLLVACANIATLLLARGSVRQREFAVRLALGASRGALVRQLLTECMLLASLGAVLGIFVSFWGTQLLTYYLSTERRTILLDLSPDVRVLLFTVALAVLTAMLSGLAPALRATRLTPNQALKEKAPTAYAEQRFGIGRILVVTQIALSLVLVFGAGLLIRSFTKLITQDLGFASHNILVAEFNLGGAGPATPEARQGVHNRLRESFAALPGVESAAIASFTPISGTGWNGEIEVAGYVPKSPRDNLAYFNRVSPEYLSTMSIRLLAGRNFGPLDRAGAPRVAIVNETLAHKFYGAQDPIGKTYSEKETQGTVETEIIGVMRDSKYLSLTEIVPPTVFVPELQDNDPSRWGAVVMKTNGDLRGIQSAARHESGGINKALSLTFHVFEKQVAESLARERTLALLSGFFGVLALLLAAIGLYGLTSYSVGRRRNEIGIRMALGAQPVRILRMILREVGNMAALGIGCGVTAAFFLSKWLATLLFGLEHRDPITFACATFVLGVVALLAGFFPARRAARLNPMDALRDE